MPISRTGESSEQVNARLRAEGRRDAFKASWAKYEQEEGYSKSDAYYVALADFPPLEECADSDGVGSVDGDGEESGGSDGVPDPSGGVELDLSTPDIRRDAYWAYNHIGRKDVTRAHAPSQGAWNMLKHFGQNAQTIRDFLEEIAKPMLKSEPKGESYSDDGRELIALCERKRAEFVAEAAREGEEDRCGHCGHLIG